MDEINKLIANEKTRQSNGLELIPSENYVSKDVLKALGSEFTNKYSEGYPNKRYYGGQEFTDQLELMTIEKAKKIFKSDHANVQPLSGAPANIAVYFSYLEPGDTVMGMDLSHGGHLTHGHPVTYMSKLFNFVRYGMKDIETGEIDYEQMRQTALKEKPKIIIAGYSSYPRELDYKKIAEIAEEVNAVAMADVAHIAGLIAGGQLENPLEHGFHVMTTTTHKTLRGPRGGMIMSMGEVSNPLKSVEKTISNLPTLIDRSVFPGLQGGPHMNVIAAKLVALNETDSDEFKVYAKNVIENAQELAVQLQNLGWKLITNGTDNHLILADVVKTYNKTGDEVEKLLDQAGLTVNKNVIPNDSQPAFKPSGIRFGTPALTTRGLVKEHMQQLAQWMDRSVQGDSENVGQEVKDFLKDFPIPSDENY